MKNTLSFLVLLLWPIILTSQIIIDYQTASNSLSFAYFGGTINGDITTTVNNPTVTGINTSSKVARFIKPANSQPWAGGANESLTHVDATSGGQICVKVNMDHIGNLALKLENPSSGGDWITQKPYTQTNQWEELCFNLTDNSIESPLLPATGRTFGKMVLFFDFGNSFSSNQTYYFDDLTYTGVPEAPSDITFSVDMNGYSNSFSTVNVSGEFNNWSGSTNPLSDPDNDGIWTGTISLQKGNYEYLFTLDNNNVQEQFSAGMSCLSNTNRLISVGSAATELCFKWNSCEACETVSCPQLVWSDEFTGSTLNSNKWTPQIGDGCPELCGWGNSELQYYRAENAVVSGGKLTISAKEENFGGKEYTSARIRTINKGDWKYGRFEASIKLPEGQGLWPAFWMLPTDLEYGTWPQSGEIDIMEYLGQETDLAFGTLHYGPPWPDNKQTGGHYKLHSGGFHEAFHEFAIEWDQNVIRWYIDDYLFSTKTAAELGEDHWPFDKEFHFILNIAVGGNLPGSPNETTVFPQTMEVEYVRVYKGKFPALTGNLDVLNRAEGEIYTVENTPAGTTFNWSVPSGATIVSGQGTHTITVDWGDTDSGGNISVSLGGNVCETQTIQQEVKVAAEVTMITEQVLENFDIDPLISFKESNGVLQEDLTNPSTNDVNGSLLVGKYSRDAVTQYDALQYVINTPIDGAPFVESNQKFYLDVYSNAPIGTVIILQLENDATSSGGNFPTGRHSRYQGVTTITNSWERIAFNYQDRPDASVPHTDVDNIVLLFAPDSDNSTMYYIDNFEIDCVNKDICTPIDACEATRSINQYDILNGTYRATNISSKGTVESGGDVQFLAENEITLQPGFQAVTGSNFLAALEDCSAAIQEESEEEYVQFILPPTKEEERFKKEGIKVFPNPFNQELTIQLKAFEQGQMRLLDATGRTHISKLITNQISLEMNALPPGIYILRVVNEETGNIFTKKIMRQK